MSFCLTACAAMVRTKLSEAANLLVQPYGVPVAVIVQAISFTVVFHKIKCSTALQSVKGFMIPSVTC